MQFNSVNEKQSQLINSSTIHSHNVQKNMINYSVNQLHQISTFMLFDSLVHVLHLVICIYYNSYSMKNRLICAHYLSSSIFYITIGFIVFTFMKKSISGSGLMFSCFSLLDNSANISVNAQNNHVLKNKKNVNILFQKEINVAPRNHIL